MIFEKDVGFQTLVITFIAGAIFALITTYAWTAASGSRLIIVVHPGLPLKVAPITALTKQDLVVY